MQMSKQVLGYKSQNQWISGPTGMANDDAVSRFLTPLHKYLRGCKLGELVYSLQSHSINVVIINVDRAMAIHPFTA